MKPIDVQIQNYSTQTGIVERPEIMWKYGPGPHTQTAYAVDVLRGETQIYSTGRTASRSQNGIFLDCELGEQTVYEYRVRVWDEAEREYESDAARFVTGVKKWRGCWIGNGSAKPFLASKTFQAKRGDQVVLSLCVPGQYQVLLNGKPVSPYAYEGCQTDFHRHVHYFTYDMTEYVREGENLLLIEVANGWYIGDCEEGKRYFYTWDKGYEPFGRVLCLLAQIRLGEEYLVSGTDWLVSPSRTTLADIYGSEDMDHTREYCWESAVCVDGPDGELIPAPYPPPVRRDIYEPVAVDAKRMLYDFGQNMSSQFRIRLKGERGQVVKLIPGEKLDSQGNLEQTVDTYSLLTLSGEEDVFEQKFSVNGARWYRVEGASADQVLEFQSFFVTSSAKACGEFQCSKEGLNRIFTLIQRAVDSNLNHSHTDCPTIEKLGWLEPNHLMGPSVMFLRDVDTLWSKIAMDMRDAQYREGEYDLDNGAFPHEYKPGLVPAIAPRYARFITDWKAGSFWDSIPWGSSIILAAWEQYRFYGNRQVLEDNYDSARAYLDYLTDQYEDYNRLYGKNGEERFICAGLGDWGIRQNGGESRENIETAFYFHDLVTMIGISDILKKSGQDRWKLQKQAERVADLYNRSLLVIDGEKAYYKAWDTGKKTPVNQALPLCFGMVPEKAKKAVEETFVSLCEESGHLQSGEIGLVYVLRALATIWCSG